MERFAILVSDISRLMRREFDARARAEGLTRPQWRLLTTLRNREGLKQGELAELLLLEPITVCRMVDRLQHAGLVERRPDPDDRRAWTLYLTAEARAVIDRLRPVALAFVGDMLEGVADAEREQAVAVLERVRGNLVRTNRT